MKICGNAMKIDKKLNLVSKIERDDGSTVYLHVIPLPYEVVQENCVLLASIFGTFYSTIGGLGSPRVAAMMLKNEIQANRQNNPDQAGKPSIIDDIQRLTSVLWYDGSTWKTTTLDSALKHGVLSIDEFREVEDEIVFFIVGCAIQKANLIEATVGSALKMYGGQLVSSSSMEYRDSLLKSKTVTDTPLQEAPPEPVHIPS